VLVAAGVVLLLLARDVQRWHGALATDDARFRAVASDDLWHPSSLIPFDAAPSLLGIRDDVEFRRALRTLRRAHPHELVFLAPGVMAARGDAQLALDRVAVGDSDASRRSVAKNFLGGLALAGAAEDDSLSRPLFASAAALFQAAIEDDPTSSDPKFNLELTLQRLHTVQGVFSPSKGRNANSEANKGAGASRAGNGY